MHIDKANRKFLDGYFSINNPREKTKKAYISDLSQFQAFVGENFDIFSLKNTDVERWVAHLKNKGYSPASIRRKIVILRVFCSYWVRQGVLSESPFWRVKINYGRILQLPRNLTEQEMQKLLTQAQKNYSTLKNSRDETKTGSFNTAQSSSRDYLAFRNIALLELLFATGMRVGEVSALDVKDFISTESSFKVSGKGGKERMAFVVDKVTVKIQLEYLDARQRLQTLSPALFLNAKGGRLSTQGIANVIHQLRKTSGIGRHITPHMLRHTVATMLLRNGVDIRVVQEFLGHASIATTQRYTHVAKEHMIRELKSRHPSLTFRRLEANKLRHSAK
ncbi:MAG TPA: tyrosine-type recombinase/integrase [Pyrinomonadaceae bacterium]|jgi:integrase/recombinase XerD